MKLCWNRILVERNLTLLFVQNAALSIGMLTTDLEKVRKSGNSNSKLKIEGGKNMAEYKAVFHIDEWTSGDFC